MMNCWPSTADSLSPTRRETVSSSPPTGKATMIFTGREGYASCAVAAPSNATRASKMPSASLMLVPPAVTTRWRPRFAVRARSPGICGLCASCQLQAFVEGGVAAHRRGHQEAVALAEDALHVVGVDVRMADHYVVLLAGVDHPRHPFEHLGMLVLAGIAELLGEIALTNQDGADAGHLAQDVGQRLDAAGVFHHQDHEDLALGVERPHVGAIVIVLLGQAPIAHGRSRPVAADAGRLVQRRAFQARIAAGGDRVVGLLHG